MQIAKITTPQEFIDELHEAATELYQQTRLYASVTLAQAALETGWLKFLPHDLTTGRNSFNIYGVKGQGPAGSVRDYTQEDEDGNWVTIIADFAAYHNYLESMQERTKLLATDPRYKPVLDAANPFVAAYALHDAGYATDQDYGQKLAEIIKEYDLTQFDLKRPVKKAAPKYNAVAGYFDDEKAAEQAAAQIKQQFGYHTQVQKA